jgi:hypothetical protein
MSSAETLSIATDDVNGCRLVAVARKEADNDRWDHRIVLQSVGETFVLLESIEGDAETAWPPSPPLQEIHLHDLGNGEALLGVGMAGTSHWSISLSTKSNSLVADLACLVKSGIAGPLSSTYRVHPAAATKSNDNGVDLLLHKVTVRLRPKTVEDFSSRIDESDDTIRIAPMMEDQSIGQKRWCFEIEIVA